MGDEQDALMHHQLIAQVGEVAGNVHEAEVGDAAGGQIPQLGHRGLMEDHLHLRIELDEPGQDVRQKNGPPPGGHPDVELLGLLGLQGPQIALQLAVQVVLPLQIGVEQLARRRQPQGGVGAVQQGHPQIGLQLGQVLAEVGLRQVEPVGGLGDAALLDNGEKVFRIFDKHGRTPPNRRIYSHYHTMKWRKREWKMKISP